jgi:hypothetical protein
MIAYPVSRAGKDPIELITNMNCLTTWFKIRARRYQAPGYAAT